MELETFFTVPEQTRLLLYAVLLGIPLGMGFDVLRTLRLLLPHGKLATALEDVSFLLVWAAALLCFSTVLARGEFRGYYWMGSALGFLLYRCTLGCVTVPLLRRIFSGLGRFFRRLFLPLFHGVVRICTPLNRKFGRRGLTMIVCADDAPKECRCRTYRQAPLTHQYPCNHWHTYYHSGLLFVPFARYR